MIFRNNINNSFLCNLPQATRHCRVKVIPSLSSSQGGGTSIKLEEMYLMKDQTTNNNDDGLTHKAYRKIPRKVPLMLQVGGIHIGSINTCMILDRVVVAEKETLVFQEPEPGQAQYVKIVKVIKDEVTNFLVNYDKDDIPRNGINNSTDEILKDEQYVYIVMRE